LFFGAVATQAAGFENRLNAFGKVDLVIGMQDWNQCGNERG
jgi:hypothetical protein